MGWRRGKGWGPGKLAPGQGKGRLVHGPGRLWPWPRRPGLWGVWSDRRGRVTGGSRNRHRSPTSSQRGRERHPSARLPHAQPPVSSHFPAHSAENCELILCGGPTFMQDGHGSRTFVPSLCRMFHGPLTSRASRGGHSLPGPPRDARDALRSAAPAGKTGQPHPSYPCNK